MANINVSVTNTFEDWRVKTNDLADAVGDVSLLPITIDSVQYADIIAAIGAISTNASDIAQLELDIISNTNSITTHSSAISTNAAAISTNATAISNNLIEVFDSAGTKIHPV